MYIARQAEIYDKPQTVFLAEQVKAAQRQNWKPRRRSWNNSGRKTVSRPSIRSCWNFNASVARQALHLLKRWTAHGISFPDLQSEEKRLRAIYLPDSPEVLRAHQNVTLAETQLSSRQGDLRARAGSVTAKINRRIATLERQRHAYDDLARQVEIR